MTSHYIRPMYPDDAEPIAGWVARIPLWQRYGIQADLLAANFQASLAANELLFVLEYPDDMIPRGFVWCLRSGAFGRSPYIRLIGVHPDYAGKGLGSALLMYIEDVCRLFSSHLFLLVSDFNRDAQRFYERHNYYKLGEIPTYVLPDVNELIYYKSLENGY